MQALALYLRQLRTTAHLTQSEAASRINIHQKTVERWEAGENEPTLTTLRAYVEKLGGSIDHAVNLVLDKMGIPEEGDPLLSSERRERLARLERLDLETLDAIIALAEQIERRGQAR